MRIGINTGEVLTGAMRAGGDYTAMGDVVNTANRLQTAAAGGQVLVGAATYHATAEAISYEPVGSISARGIDEPIEAWRALEVLLLPGRHPRHRRSPLVGRDEELSLLRQAVELAFTRSRSNLILVLGDAGVGKTRLADEIAEWAACEHGARHIESRCVPYGEANIWYPIGAALGELCGVAEGASQTEAQKGCTAAVADVFGADPESPTVVQVANSLMYLMGYDGPLRNFEPQRAREEASRAVVRFLDAICAKGPLLFRLADLHWADDVVLALIDDILTRLSRSPFCLVAGARHLIDPRWAPRSGRHNTVVVNLDPLDGTAASQLLEHLVDHRDLPHGLRDTLLVRSGGNPFFLEELVALTDRADEPLEAGRLAEWTSSAAAEAELPETLRGLVAARLDRLPREERAVVEDAAVVGRTGPAVRARGDRRTHRWLRDLAGRTRPPRRLGDLRADRQPLVVPLGPGPRGRLLHVDQDRAGAAPCGDRPVDGAEAARATASTTRSSTGWRSTTAWPRRWRRSWASSPACRATWSNGRCSGWGRRGGGRRRPRSTCWPPSCSARRCASPGPSPPPSAWCSCSAGPRRTGASTSWRRPRSTSRRPSRWRASSRTPAVGPRPCSPGPRSNSGAGR